MGRSDRDVNNENTITVFGKSFAKAFGVSYITARALNAAFDVDGAAEAEQKHAEKVQAQMRADLEREEQKKQSHKEEQSKIEKQEHKSITSKKQNSTSVSAVGKTSKPVKEKSDEEVRKELAKYGGSIADYVNYANKSFEENGGFFKF